MSTKFKTETFDDLSKCNLDKLRKLRDIAEDYRQECTRELGKAAKRVGVICDEINRRQWSDGDGL